MAAPPGIPIRRPGVSTASGPSAEGLLLVGHGSVCPRSRQEMESLAQEVALALPDVAVEVGFLEMTRPAAGAVVDSMIRRGCRRVVVLPLVLLAAGHAKSDVPAVVVDARYRHPDMDIRFGRPLGVSRAAIEVLGKLVAAAGGAGLPLLVVARGTSDPDANAEAHKAARLLAEWTGAPFVHVGFSGVTRPLVGEAATVFERLGYPRVAVAWWYLCHGKLIERGRAELARFAADSGVEIVDAGHLAADVALAPLVVERYREATGGAVVVNCDTCAYRSPWPGREDRVGQAIGVGHSHLAVAHRHSH
jgi:sirohydrochlorin cobaltochelatase